MALLVGLSACGTSEPDPTPGAIVVPVEIEVVSPPNIILITLDTLRPDHLGAYGYPRSTSTHIDAFASVATLYTRAYAASPWTLPSHASLFTGMYPSEHGARTFKGGKGRAREGILDDRHWTLAEALQAEGYQTAAFAGNAVYLKERFQLNQGFDTYFNERTYARTMLRLVVAWLKKHHDEPFFLFINFVDTHNPYNSGRRRDDPGFLGKADERQSYHLYEELRPRVLKREEPLPRERIELLKNQYDTAIFNLDAELRGLFRTLERLEIYDDSMIVLTSDHGEFFGEHELIDHGKDVYDPVLRVPLIIKNPDQIEGRIDETVIAGPDIPHLILSQLPEAMAQRSLARFSRAPGGHPVLSESHYTMAYDYNRNPWERDRFDRVRTAVVKWPYKLIHDSTGRHELYHLEQDPGETTDLYAPGIEIAERLQQHLESHQATRTETGLPQQVRPPTQHEIEQLRALGYLGEDDDATP